MIGFVVPPTVPIVAAPVPAVLVAPPLTVDSIPEIVLKPTEPSLTPRTGGALLSELRPMDIDESAVNALVDHSTPPSSPTMASPTELPMEGRPAVVERPEDPTALYSSGGSLTGE